MIGGITQQMDEGVFDLLQDAFVQFRLVAGNGQIDLFPLLPGQVPDHPVERDGNR